jgi:hypothetical protein
MIYASIIYRDYKKNSLFKEGAGENNGEFYLPYKLLREAFLVHGIELNTPDINIDRKIAFELHINCRRQDSVARAYVYLYENPLIRPLNRDRIALSRYRKWFTWDESLLNDPRAVRLFYPNKIEENNFSGPESRDLYCVLVASNKALAIADDSSQYQDRVKIINWYEKFAPNDFHLYGAGWNRPAALSGRFGRIYNQIIKFVLRITPSRSPLKTWRGRVENKMDILNRARFCIAHENCRDLPGYITEKLFDSFRAGCVPIYIGPSEIHEYIPWGCFIDGRKFSNPAEMDAFLRAIDDETYRGYQKSIKDFLLSERAKPFSQEYFVDTIVQTILADLAANKP